MHRLGCPQFFVPVYRAISASWPRANTSRASSEAAVRQQTRWITGIALQSWQRHGWRDTATQLYWFWRDRKGLVGNLAAPLSNVLFVYGAADVALEQADGRALGPGARCPEPFLRLHSSARWDCSCSTWRSGRFAARASMDGVFALAVPVRAIWGNWINCFATVMAYYRYFSAVSRGQPLVWLKTEHAYPSRAALVENKQKLGEVLVWCQYLGPAGSRSGAGVKARWHQARRLSHRGGQGDRERCL